jgi:hypothetical protein
MKNSKLESAYSLPKPAPTNEGGRMQIWSQYLNFLRFEKLLIDSRNHKQGCEIGGYFS